MDFTYSAYQGLLTLLKQKNYEFVSYNNTDTLNKKVILRHDIDNSLAKALEIAKIEHRHKIRSTFFVLLSTDFYNIFSKKSHDLIYEIIGLGHDIGLHFDEKRYTINCEKELETHVGYEKMILGKALNRPIKVVSMHRPSPWILENNIHFKDIINTYTAKFLHDFKYLSDSRMHWREDVNDIINSDKFDKLHILTHPFWYAKDKGDLKSRVKCYIKQANKERYFQLKDNIRDMEKIIGIGEVL